MGIDLTEIEMIDQADEARRIEARTVAALRSLGYAVPEHGMPLMKAMGLIADALEDLASDRITTTSGAIICEASPNAAEFAARYRGDADND